MYKLKTARLSARSYPLSSISTALYFLLAAIVVSVYTSAKAASQPATEWAFEATFDGDPPEPSQDLLSRQFEYVVTHRTHPKEHFTKSFPAYPADHAANCAGPNPTVVPLPQHEVFTTNTSNSLAPDPSFFLCKNHMMSSMGEVEAYSNSLFWPRRGFDFSEGGTLEFEVNINEGHTIRSWWEILIAPREQMHFASAPLQSAVDETYPQDRIVLDFRGNVRRIRVGQGATAPDGWTVDERQFGPYDYLDWRDLHPEDPALDDRRIRRTMRIRFEEDRITWGIVTADGTVDEFSAAIPGGLPFTQGIVQFKTHAYTPLKLSNQGYYTFHWDNIRFTGPRLFPYRVFHASDVVYLQRNGDRPLNDTATVSIDLPRKPGENPVLTGQIHAPLIGQPRVSINGGPEITIGPADYPVENCSSGEWRDWRTFRQALPASALRVGENTLRWRVGPRPACATDDFWWNGYSVKSLQIQTDPPTGELPPGC